ncbi:MAG: dipeptidase [Sphingorhabdus sp.]
MKGKILWALPVLLVVAAIGFFGFAPGMAEKSMNKIDGKPLPEIRADALALHKGLTIVDLHSDSLMWSRDLTKRAARGHMDLPRLQDGNVALQVFSSVTKTPKNQNYDSNSADGDNITMLVVAQLQPYRTWHSLLERSLWHAVKLNRAVEHTSGFWKVRSNADVSKLLEARKCDTCTGISNTAYASTTPGKPLGALLSIEGLHDLEGARENLDKLYDAGFRMAGLTHFFDNRLAGSMHGEKKGGLTPFGREIIRAMEDKGMIVDIAHLSHKGVAELLAMAQRPVVSSHGGAQATCDVNRNLTDEEIKGVAATGGIIGIGYWESAVCDTSPQAAAAAMKHVRDLVGIGHVALGSDYDGATTVRFDTAGLVHVTQALIDIGFSESEIRAVMGGNAIRVISEGLKPMAMLSKSPTAQ